MRKGGGNWDRLAWRREGSLKGASKQEGEWPKEAVDAASLEAFKARLDVARGILV